MGDFKGGIDIRDIFKCSVETYTDKDGIFDIERYINAHYEEIKGDSLRDVMNVFMESSLGSMIIRKENLKKDSFKTFIKESIEESLHEYMNKAKDSFIKEMTEYMDVFGKKIVRYVLLNIEDFIVDRIGTIKDSNTDLLNGIEYDVRNIRDVVKDMFNDEVDIRKRISSFIVEKNNESLNFRDTLLMMLDEIRSIEKKLKTTDILDKKIKDLESFIMLSRYVLIELSDRVFVEEEF
ncbi:hypothetical protein PilKf_00145 [Pillotina sp. SPG140]|jgi:hypothetical protein